MSPDDADLSPVVYAYVSVLDKSMASECRPQRVSAGLSASLERLDWSMCQFR